jgi:hypothetical protein
MKEEDKREVELGWDQLCKKPKDFATAPCGERRKAQENCFEKSV